MYRSAYPARLANRAACIAPPSISVSTTINPVAQAGDDAVTCNQIRSGRRCARMKFAQYSSALDHQIGQLQVISRINIQNAAAKYRRRLSLWHDQRAHMRRRINANRQTADNGVTPFDQLGRQILRQRTPIPRGLACADDRNPLARGQRPVPAREQGGRCIIA